MSNNGTHFNFYTLVTKIKNKKTLFFRQFQKWSYNNMIDVNVKVLMSWLWGVMPVEDHTGATVSFNCARTIFSPLAEHWHTACIICAWRPTSCKSKYYWTASVCRHSFKRETVKTYISSASPPHWSGHLPTQMNDVIREMWRLGSQLWHTGSSWGSTVTSSFQIN